MDTVRAGEQESGAWRAECLDCGSGWRTVVLCGLCAECRVLAVRECAWKLAEIVVGTNFRRCFFLLFSVFSFVFFCWLLSSLEVDRVVVVVVAVQAVGVRDVRHR